MSLWEVRKRPGMYIGDTTDGSGLHNMIFELVSNAIPEARAGFADRIDVILGPDGSCTVRDNGRGIPADLHPGTGLSAREMIMTQLHAGAMFARASRDVPSELHGVGAAVVNAISETLLLRIWRNGNEYAIRFHQGVPETSLEIVGPAGLSGVKNRRGTEITSRRSKISLRILILISLVSSSDCVNWQSMQGVQASSCETRDRIKSMKSCSPLKWTLDQCATS